MHTDNTFMMPKVKTNPVTVEKERLYEESFQMKNKINNLKKEISLLKSELLKKEQEVNKKDRILEEITNDSQNNMFMMPVDNKIVGKAKEATLINNMKKQYKELKKQFKEKCDELENVKKVLKISKINELNIENRTLLEELNKIKAFYLLSAQQNETNEKNFKDYSNLQENLSKQHLIILTLNDNINKLQEDMRMKDEEFFKINQTLSDKNNALKKVKKDLKFANSINDRLSKEKKDNSEIMMLKQTYDKKLQEVSKELNYFRDLADKRDRKARELETNMKKMGAGNSQGFNNMQYQDIKYIQENPEDKYDNITLLLKSKLKETIEENEKLQLKNKQLEEKLRLLDGGYAAEESKDGGIYFK